ncbi:MAG: OsmC family protein [Parachlamydiales bacterium]|nr:OsmC family protein [Parachlamydiales bacterium]
MADIQVKYDGQLRTITSFKDGAVTLITDGPKQYGGLNEFCSSTDLLAVSWASCVLTMMGMTANSYNVSLDKAVATVTKALSAQSPFVVEMTLHIHCPEFVPEDIRKKIEAAAHVCPVHTSLSPKVIKDFRIHWE